MVDFPTIRFFPILVSFLSFSDFKKFFQRKILEKKFLARDIKIFLRKKLAR